MLRVQGELRNRFKVCTFLHITDNQISTQGSCLWFSEWGYQLTKDEKTNKDQAIVLFWHANISLIMVGKAKCMFKVQFDFKYCICVAMFMSLSYPVQVELYWGPLWLFQSPAPYRPRWLQWCPTDGHTLCPTCPLSAPRRGPPRAEVLPSDGLQAGRKKWELRW